LSVYCKDIGMLEVLVSSPLPLNLNKYLAPTPKPKLVSGEKVATGAKISLDGYNVESAAAFFLLG